MDIPLLYGEESKHRDGCDNIQTHHHETDVAFYRPSCAFFFVMEIVSYLLPSPSSVYIFLIRIQFPHIPPLSFVRVFIFILSQLCAVDLPRGT
jgi:hypothetical protein